MSIRSDLVLPLVAALICAPLVAQPTITPPDYALAAVGNPITIAGDFVSMAADRHDDVYILQGGQGAAVVHRVRSDGTIDMNHATGFGMAQQLAYNPTDGLVYLAEYTPVLPVIQSQIWRIEPTGGATNVGNVAVVASGLAIDDQGRFYFFGNGVSAYGLFRTASDFTGLTFLGAIFGGNPFGPIILQSLTSGDVLCALGPMVQRYDAQSGGHVFYYSVPGGGGGPGGAASTVRSMARIPHDPLGAGALLGINEATPALPVRKAISADLVGGNVADFAVEPVNSIGGTVLLAGGPGGDSWWLSTVGGGFPGAMTTGQLYRISEIPAAGNPGTLLVTTAPGSVTLEIFGPPNAAFEFGVMPDPLPTDHLLFVPTLGLFDLNPFHPAYLAVFDGFALYGPPNPYAVIPPSGHFIWTETYPPFASAIALAGQALVVAGDAAANGLLQVSNVAFFTVQ
jgi:hypothetical protein